MERGDVRLLDLRTELDAERAVWPVLVVVAAVDREDVVEVAPPEDQDLVEAIGANRAHPALREGVRVCRLDWCADHLDAFGAEDLLEGVAELGVPVVDEEPERPLVTEVRDQVARLLGDPASVRLALEAMYSIRRVSSEMKKRT
jgi:hypothetical protein